MEVNVFSVGAHLFGMVIWADIFVFLGRDCFEKMEGVGVVMKMGVEGVVGRLWKLWKWYNWIFCPTEAWLFGEDDRCKSGDGDSCYSGWSFDVSVV